MDVEELLPTEKTISQAKEEEDSQTQQNFNSDVTGGNAKQEEPVSTALESSVDPQKSKEDAAYRESEMVSQSSKPANENQREKANKKERRYESFTDTYDVITGSEVRDLTGWESIHKNSLSEIPPIDHAAINDLESRAKDVASNLDHLLGTLAASLKSLSVISVQSVDTYKTSIQNVEDSVDLSIKNMYTLIAKCEELNSHMGPLYNIAAQIKDIKRTLDVFESVCK